MNLNREGIFLATLADKAVSLKNDKTQFVAKYSLTSEWNGSEYADIGEQGATIVGYHYLEKNDGSLNDSTIKQLRDATGWDGRDPFALEELPADLVVKITVEAEEYEGRNTLKVKWVDNKDSTGGGGVKKANDQERAAIKARLGQKLRAQFGAPVQTPKPTGAPSMPKRTPPVTHPAAKQPKPAPGCTMDEAWQKLCVVATDQERASIVWTGVLDRLFPGKQDSDLKPEDWAKVRDECLKDVMPM